MKNISSIILLLVISCTGRNNTDSRQSDINLYVETELTVDSIFVSNITQNREFQFLPFSNEMHIELNDSINDLYNINFYAKEGFIMNQMWLDGENIVIRGKLTKRFEVDTVIGSRLYYVSVDHKKRYGDLLKSDADSASINEFLLEELNKNIDNPYSIEISKEFYRRNISRKNELQRIYEVLQHQDEMIKQHGINPVLAIENILTTDRIDFNKFQFLDLNSQIASIVPEKDKTLLLDFWFVGCAPCIIDHRSIQNQLDKLEEKKIKVIGISIDHDHSLWKNFVEEKGYDWINYRESDNHSERMRAKLFISMFPTYMIVNPDGKIMLRTNSLEVVERYLGIKTES